MAEKKHTSFALLQILQEESDENHILNASQLAEKLDQRLNVRVERRTIYSNIEMLEQKN